MRARESGRGVCGRVRAGGVRESAGGRVRARARETMRVVDVTHLGSEEEWMAL